MWRRLAFLLIPLALAVGILAMLNGPDLFVEQTSSMAPLIKPGDLIIDHHLQTNETPQVGQIVGYRYGNMLITHRIIAVNRDGTYTIKGDANPLPDPFPVSRSQIREIVIFTVPAAGKALKALTSLPAALTIALLIFAGGMLIAWLRRRRVTSPRPAKQLKGEVLTRPEFHSRDEEDEEQRRAA